MAGLAGYFVPITPRALEDYLRHETAGRGIAKTLCGRRFSRAALEELWRLWPSLDEAGRAEVRELLWHTGVIPRLLASVAKRHGAHRTAPFSRLLSLSDPHTLAPLLAIWPRLTPSERDQVLALAGRLNPPNLARLLWHAVALGARVPVDEMARLVPAVGPALVCSLGNALHDREASAWAWRVLVRLKDKQAQEYLLDCLARQDELGEQAKHYFALAPAGQVLTVLMEAARFHRSWEVRVGAVTALLRRREPPILSFLIGLLRDDVWYGPGAGHARAY